MLGPNPGVLLVGVTPGGLEKMFAERQSVDSEAERTLMKMHKMEVVGPPLRRLCSCAVIVLQQTA